MQLTQFTDYSLRALIYIALKQKICTISDIAIAYNISNNHLVKIIHNLAQIKLIHTTRGKNGGISLAVDPKEVNIGELVVKLEPHFDLVPCFSKEKSNCCIAPACRLKTVLQRAQQAFIEVLYEVSLAEVIHNPEDLKTLLNIPIPLHNLET